MSNYEGIYDDLIQVPATDDLFATFASTVHYSYLLIMSQYLEDMM